MTPPAPAPADKLVDAVIAVLLEEGFEGVSVRKVATRAGVSIGAVQHHFPTKDAMLTAAMDRASAEFEQRLAADLPADPSAEQALRAVVDELVGAGEARRTATIVWTQRLARAMVDGAMRERHAREWRQVEDLLAGLLRAVRPQRGESWARDSAASLLALLDGLAVAQVTEPDRIDEARARRLASDALAATLGAVTPPVA